MADEKIVGIVERIRYTSEHTGYTVCDIVVHKDTITIVGIMPFLSVGEQITAIGSYGSHREFGMQFNVVSFEKSLPSDTTGILKYLSSGSIKGIGVSTAARIVDMFGDDTFNVIENSPHLLVRIKGINSEKAIKISAIFREQFGIRELFIFFSKYSVPPSKATSVFKRWGHLAIEIIKANPYIISNEPISVSFEICDKMALSLGVSLDDPLRIGAGICYVLNHNFFSNGHTFLPIEYLRRAVTDFLDVSFDKVTETIERLTVSGELVSVVIKDRQAIYLKRSYNAEMDIATELYRRTSKAESYQIVDSLIENIEKNHNISYDVIQKKAISLAVNNTVMVLTGGPGTGKTTTLRAMINVFEQLSMKVVLCAPTGRAVKRMEELCLKEAKTIHRLLEMEYTGDNFPRFGKCKDNKIEGDVIIVDEVSMVDISLLDALLKAMDIGTRLILVGDADQLPSVGAGNVIRDITFSGVVPTVKLDKIFRQAMKSLIVQNSHNIIKGIYPELSIKNNDFFFINRHTDSGVIETICELVSKRLPNTYNFDPITHIQVIAPSRKSSTGTCNLNAILRDVLNPKTDKSVQKKCRDITFRVNDKVMQTKNNYDIMWVRDNGEGGAGIFNGDIGTIISIDNSLEIVEIKFDDRVATYDFSSISEIEHAYAITVHKSQGSEFEAVIIPVFGGSDRLFYRNLLYTAVTRAKKLLILVGNKDRITQMVDNNTTQGRYTGLKYLLIDKMEEEA